MKEEYFLGLVEITGSKGAHALCQKCLYKIVIKQLRFHGLDGTNAMSANTLVYNADLSLKYHIQSM